MSTLIKDEQSCHPNNETQTNETDLQISCSTQDVLGWLAVVEGIRHTWNRGNGNDAINPQFASKAMRNKKHNKKL